MQALIVLLFSGDESVTDRNQEQEKDTKIVYLSGRLFEAERTYSVLNIFETLLTHATIATIKALSIPIHDSEARLFPLLRKMMNHPSPLYQGNSNQEQVDLYLSVWIYFL
jgi:hypothetical protein